MKFNTSLSLLAVMIIVLTWQRYSVNGKRILIVTPTPMHSHQISYRSLWTELHKRGHELVVVTPFRIEDPSLKNYTEIHFGAACEMFDQLTIDGTARRLAQSETRMKVEYMSHILAESLLQLPDFRKLYVSESEEKFDAVIVETLFSPIFYLLGYRFDAPLIGIMPLQLHNIDRYFVGSPIISSHLSNWETEGITEYPTFWQRLRNFIDTWSCIYYWLYDYLPLQQSIARKYFGDDIPDIVGAGKNMSLILANSHAFNLYARPDVPTVVYYNGGHITKIPPALPTDLREFLDNAANGFIYMSLGTTIRYRFLAQKPKELLMNVLSKLPWPVVWKRDDMETVQQLSYNPNKIYFSNWVPQQGILAHPNIKLFIYQGGLQSTEEAMHYGVPVLGIPIMFDQEHNMKKIVSLGAGQRLIMATLTEINMRNAIYEIINNKSYKEKMLELRSLSKDLPYDPLKNAVWWIEYVIRTKGAPHLQFYDKYKPLYQQYNVDIIAFVMMVTNLILVLLLVFILIFSWYAIKRCQSIYFTTLLKIRKEKVH